MKRNALAAAIASVGVIAAANQAAALTPADIADFAHQVDVRVYISGSAAQDVALRENVKDVCNADIISMSNGTTAPGTAQSAYFCTSQLAGLPDNDGDGQVRVLIYKRSSGDSAYGVGPVQSGASVAFLDETACPVAPVATPPAGIANHWNCGTATQNHVATAGISDVEPAMFTGPNLLLNTPEDPQTTGAPGTSDFIPTTLVGHTLNTSVFGIIVTTQLRNALQAAQGQTVGSELQEQQPYLPSAAVVSLFAGDIPTWDKFTVSDSNNDPHTGPTYTLPQLATAKGLSIPSNLKINICRRAQGSGTQAQFNANFFRTPCVSGATAPLNDNTGFTSRKISYSTGSSYNFTNIGGALGAGGVPAAAPAVHENSGQGDLEQCMSQLNTSNTTRWGVGIGATERGTKTDFRFVAIDDVFPTTLATAGGFYQDWATASINWNESGSFQPTAGQLALLNGIRAKAQLPSDLATINAALTKPAGADYTFGLLSNPDATLGYAPSYPWDESNPVVNVARVQGGVPNTCAPARYYGNKPYLHFSNETAFGWDPI